MKSKSKRKKKVQVKIKTKTAKAPKIKTASPVREFENIVEYCYHAKNQKFVVRFLDGTSCVLKVTDLPPKLLTRKPRWEEVNLSNDKKSLVVPSGKGIKEIPSHIIHSKGKIV